MKDKNELEKVEAKNYDVQLKDFEKGLIIFLEDHDLPSEALFVDIHQRLNVFNNLEGVITKIPKQQKQQSLYLSKFIAAAASGLFDAALNYLWDETIIQIRKRVIQYDLQYFFDNAATGDKRKRLKDESDLPKLDDYELIKGAKEIGLISDLGFKHLEYINYMRNWASAAHPNQNEVTGLQLISWLESCVKEVITLPISNIAIEIKQLLAGIKTTEISDQDAQEIGIFFTNLTQEQVNNLVSGFFGIYTKTDADSKTIKNINKLLPLIWNRVDEDTRYSFGLKYGNYAANNYQKEKKSAREFLQIVNAESYLPGNIRLYEIETALDNLLRAHRAFNNFYNEPSFASQLSRMIGTPAKVPKGITKKYVLTLVEVYLTNAHGVAVDAEPYYYDLINQFDSHQANIAVLSFNDSHISNKLQFDLCQRKYKELIDILRGNITTPAVKELIEKIDSFKYRLDNLKNDNTIKTKVQSLRVLL